MDGLHGMGLGSKLCLVLCKYRLPIGGFLLIESLNHTTSLALGPKFLSIAGKDSFTLNQILTNLSHLGLAVDLSNDSRCLGLGSKLCLVLSKDCLPIHGILLIKLLNHMVSLGLGSKLCLVLSKDCLPIHGILLIKLLNHMVSLGLGSKLCLVLCKY